MAGLIIAACVLGILVVGLALMARVCRSMRAEIGAGTDNCP